MWVSIVDQPKYLSYDTLGRAWCYFVPTHFMGTFYQENTPYGGICGQFRINPIMRYSLRKIPLTGACVLFRTSRLFGDIRASVYVIITYRDTRHTIKTIIFTVEQQRLFLWLGVISCGFLYKSYSRNHHIMYHHQIIIMICGWALWVSPNILDWHKGFIQFVPKLR